MRRSSGHVLHTLLYITPPLRAMRAVPLAMNSASTRASVPDERLRPNVQFRLAPPCSALPLCCVRPRGRAALECRRLFVCQWRFGKDRCKMLDITPSMLFSRVVLLQSDNLAFSVDQTFLNVALHRRRLLPTIELMRRQRHHHHHRYSNTEGRKSYTQSRSHWRRKTS